MKDKFIKNTIILLIGGILTKLLGIIIRIVLTRTLTLDEIGLYMMILPTFSLFANINELSFMKSISKLVSENRYKCKNLLFSILPISLLINILLTIFLIFTSNFIANNLLHNSNAYLPILAISLVLPFQSLSNILRGFFFGKEKMVPHIISNLTEQIIRLVLIILIIPKYLDNIIITVTIIIIINAISELTGALILFFFIPKKMVIKKIDLKPKKTYIKSILSISLPSTTTRIIGTISYFLEPIILTNIMLNIGYSNSYITSEYGIITAYIMPLLLMPSFFTNTLNNATLPIISREYIKNNLDYIKSKFKKVLLISLSITIISIIFINIFPVFLLKFFYNTNQGIIYLRLLSPIFLLSSIESTLKTFLEAMGKFKDITKINTISNIIKIIVLIISTYLKIGLYSLIISIAINTIINLVLYTKKYLISIKK